jgi:hypothetical protein
MISITKARLCSLLLSASIGVYFSSLSAQDQIDEQEPNHPCEQAQFVGEAPLPFFIPGSLDSTEQDPDVDFYRITGLPGQLVSITLEGQATGMGTLSDPYLGFFDESCQLQAINDDDGSTLNSKLVVTLPDSGEYVIGVSQCCDYLFTGGGIGTYTLTVFEPVLIQYIAGRVVDSDTLSPLPGDSYPYAGVSLHRCNDFDCNQWVNSQATAPDGTFMFTNDYMGMPLTAGIYVVNVFAQWYEMGWFEPFEVLQGEAADLGDLPLVPMAMIGSITGRMVDALHNTPLPGSTPPFTMVDIERCEEWGCYAVIGGLQTDDQGYFYVDGETYGLSPGTYRVMARADDYYPLASDPFTLDDKESIDLQDLPMMPLPIGFGEIVGCDVLPMGGVCKFSVAITNRGEGRYHGQSWAIVQYFSQTFPNQMNWFQVGRAGAKNPNPLRVNLGEDKWMNLGFSLEIPQFVPEGTALCVSVNVGRDPYPQFDASGDRLLFCATTQQNNELVRLSYKDSKRLLRKKEKPEKAGHQPG